jgi:hypothetical protein
MGTGDLVDLLRRLLDMTPAGRGLLSEGDCG